MAVILSNTFAFKRFDVLSVGITNNLIRRIYEHKNKIQEDFTKKYNLEHLVYYEIYHNIIDAIASEKQLKGWARKKKDELVNKFNPKWKDLYKEIC